MTLSDRLEAARTQRARSGVFVKKGDPLLTAETLDEVEENTLPTRPAKPGAASKVETAADDGVVSTQVELPAGLEGLRDSATEALYERMGARITDSSKTKTGMVLGTPSYMSPEQLAGKKIDGQSDLFSLGVTLYQLSCGSLPFTGESMTQLMFKIANEPPVDILSLNPALPECLVEIINKALAKDVEQRYRTGDEFARAIRDCAAQFGGGVDVAL